MSKLCIFCLYWLGIMVLHLKNSFVSLKINYLMYFFKTGSFRPNQSRLDRFRSVNRFIRWTGPVTGSGFKNTVRDRGDKKPYSWWATHGATIPPLQQLATRLLSQVTSSSCCERNWSTYVNLYSVKKSKLEQSKAETMVYVHTNLCLIYR